MVRRPADRSTETDPMTWRACAAQIRPTGFPPGLLLAAACGAAGLTLLTGPALAAEGAKGGASEVIFLAQLITLMLVGRLLGEAMNRIGQPSIMGMLLGGILLGPSALGALLPDLQHALFPKTPEQKAMLDGISQFGTCCCSCSPGWRPISGWCEGLAPRR